MKYYICITLFKSRPNQSWRLKSPSWGPQSPSRVVKRHIYIARDKLVILTKKTSLREMRRVLRRVASHWWRVLGRVVHDGERRARDGGELSAAAQLVRRREQWAVPRGQRPRPHARAHDVDEARQATAHAARPARAAARHRRRRRAAPRQPPRRHRPLLALWGRLRARPRPRPALGRRAKVNFSVLVKCTLLIPMF